MGPTLAVLPLRGEPGPDAVSLKSVTDGSETRMCGAPGGSSDAGRRLPRRDVCCWRPPPPTPCCRANVSSAACSACPSNVTYTGPSTRAVSMRVVCTDRAPVNLGRAGDRPTDYHAIDTRPNTDNYVITVLCLQNTGEQHGPYSRVLGTHSLSSRAVFTIFIR